MNIKKTYLSTRNFVRNHKTAIAFCSGAALGIVLNKYAIRDHDNFLKEKGLYEEYYTPTDEEMGV